MKIHKLHLMLIVLLLTLTNCKKEEESSINGGALEPIINGRVTKLSIVNSNPNYPSDTNYYHYNYQDNLLSYTVNEYGRYFDTIFYFYNNTNQLDYVARKKAFGNLDTLYRYEFNANNELVKEFDYSNNQIYGYVEFNYSGTNLTGVISNYPNYSEEFRIRTINNNIITAELIKLNGSTPNNKTVFELKYDQFSNPYQGILISDNSIIQYFSKNNLTEIREIEDGSVKNLSVINYSYNFKNLPETRTEIEDQISTKYIYEYD